MRSFHGPSSTRPLVLLALAAALVHCGGSSNNPDGSTPGTDGGHTGDGSTQAACGTTGTTTVTGHWSTVTTVDGESSINFAGVWASSPSDVWVVGVTDVLHYNGTAWAKTQVAYDTFGVGGSGPNDVWISALTIPANGSGNAGTPTMLHATGSGDPMPTTLTGTEYGMISMSAANDGWAVGQGAPIHWNGTAWTATGNGIGATELLRGVFARGPNDAYAVGEHTYHWDGTSWTAAGLAGETSFYNAVWSNCVGDVWYGGAMAYLEHLSGTTWAATPDSPEGDSDDVNGMWGAAANDLWAVGNAGHITHFDGTTWTDVPSTTTQKLAAVWGTSATDVWAVGDNGTVLHYTP